MQPTVEPVARLVEEFARLPGIGPKTAQRLTFYLLRMPAEHARALAEAILHMKEAVHLCSVCANITDADPCPICRSETRDHATICVVEEPLDILALERTREFKGVYHVLHGALSPLENIGPEHLKIDLMPSRTRFASFWNSGPRWSMMARSIARRMRSGTGEGPGICRKCRPAMRFVF